MLIVLLAINGVMFVLELTVGLFVESTALIADALDMLADATVYAISLYAVRRASRHKINAAMLSGIMRIILGIGVVAEVVRRFVIGSEPEPSFSLDLMSMDIQEKRLSRLVAAVSGRVPICCVPACAIAEKTIRL